MKTGLHHLFCAVVEQDGRKDAEREAAFASRLAGEHAEILAKEEEIAAMQGEVKMAKKIAKRIGYTPTVEGTTGARLDGRGGKANAEHKAGKKKTYSKAKNG